MPMKKQPIQSATSLPPSPDEERRGRMIKYTIAMSIRFVCIVLVFVVPDWWRLVPAIGAILLPYIAVVIANTAGRTSAAPVVSTGAILPTTFGGPRDATARKPVPHDPGADA
jgi:predicted tellurium resistance membrane protein TerC